MVLPAALVLPSAFLWRVGVVVCDGASVVSGGVTLRIQSFSRRPSSPLPALR